MTGMQDPVERQNEIQSIDEKILRENVQNTMFFDHERKKQTPGLSFATLGSHKVILVVVAGFFMVSLAGLGLLGRQKHASEKPLSPTSGRPAEAEVTDADLQTVDYSTTTEDPSSGPSVDTASFDNEITTGSSVGSGSGVLYDSTVTAATSSVPSVPAPSAPPSIHISSRATSFIITWTKTANATQYVVELSSTASFADARQITSGNTELTVPNLLPATTYYVHIRSVGVAGMSGWSGTVNASTTNLPPSIAQQPLLGAMSQVNVAATSARSMQISWTGAANASGYTVFRAQDAQMKSAKKEYASTSATSYTISDLVPGTKYYFIVQPSNDHGMGPPSAVVSGKTWIDVPAIATAVIGMSSVKPTWKAQTGASDYTVQLASKSDFSNAKTTTVRGLSTTFSGLNKGSTYYIHIRATDGSYTTGWSRAVKVITHAYTYHNPIIKSAGGAPTIIQDNDGMYYIYVTHDCGGQLFCRWKSKNLVNWTEMHSDIFTKKPAILGGRNIDWAPDITKVGDTFIMTYSGCDDAKVAVGHRRCVGYATSKSAAGPFTPRGVLVSRGYSASTDIASGPGAIDSHIVVDGGKVYLLYGSGGIEIVPLRSTGNGTYEAVRSQAKLLVGSTAPVAEGSYLKRANGYWYLYYSYGVFTPGANGTSKEYSTRVVRSKNIMGPYAGPRSAAPRNNSEQKIGNGKFVMLMSGYSTFHGPGCPTLFTDALGQDWIVYHAYAGKGSDRLTMLDRIVYKDGWPGVSGNRPSSATLPAPAVDN